MFLLPTLRFVKYSNYCCCYFINEQILDLLQQHQGFGFNLRSANMTSACTFQSKASINRNNNCATIRNPKVLFVKGIASYVGCNVQVK